MPAPVFVVVVNGWTAIDAKTKRRLVNLQTLDRDRQREQMDHMIELMAGWGWIVEDRRDELIPAGAELKSSLVWYQR